MPKVETYITPVGRVKFPKTIINDKEYGHIVHPQGLTEDDNYQCKFTLVIDKDKAKDITKMLDEQAQPIKGANFKPYKNDKIKNEDESITETEDIAINFTSSYPPSIFDAKLEKSDAVIGWGSKVKVKFTTKPVNNKGKVGLGRYVRAIQIIELSESSSGAEGFTPEEGYSSKPSNSPDPWNDEEESK